MYRYKSQTLYVSQYVLNQLNYFFKHTYKNYYFMCGNTVHYYLLNSLLNKSIIMYIVTMNFSLIITGIVYNNFCLYQSPQLSYCIGFFCGMFYNYDIKQSIDT